MSLVLHGVVHGKLIELRDSADLPEGSEVQIVLLDDGQEKGLDHRMESFPLPRRMQVARAAFLRDLPAKLADRRSTGKWLLYRGADCVKCAKTQQELVRHCQKQGWNAADCYIDMVIPHPHEPEVVDPSLFETQD